MEFPKDFFWGAATSSHQVEGNNTNNDWWEWEKRGGGKGASGDACRHYELYRQDFDLAQGLSHNAHRLSIEWSRVHPEENQFSEQEIKHYADVINSLKERNLEPVVTLHHFTNPLWLSRMGGWENKKAVGLFLSYAEKIVDALSPDVKYWVTINEPTIYIYFSYIDGSWPPQVKSASRAKKVRDNLIAAHVKAYRSIHQIYKNKGLQEPFISIAHHMQAFVPCSPALKNRFAAYLRHKAFNLDFLERLLRYKSLDFIGLNYYSRSKVDVKRWGIKNLVFDVCESNHNPVKKNSLGWDIYPQGLYELLIKLSRYKLPVFILENGICTEDDTLRWEFIKGHLEKLLLAVADGAKVIGYIYWALMDNFEWDKGFAPRFGLIEVDYNTYQRRVRESAKKLALVCKSGKLG
jgi:beta-glucosidase